MGPVVGFKPTKELLSEEHARRSGCWPSGPGAGKKKERDVRTLWSEDVVIWGHCDPRIARKWHDGRINCLYTIVSNTLNSVPLDPWHIEWHTIHLGCLALSALERLKLHASEINKMYVSFPPPHPPHSLQQVLNQHCGSLLHHRFLHHLLHPASRCDHFLLHQAVTEA